MIAHWHLAVLEKVIHIILQSLFPPVCAGCGAGGTFICARCTHLSQYLGSECFFCGLKAEKGALCQRCRPQQPFEAIVWQWRYNHTKARAIIAAYKYKKKRALAPALASALETALAKLDLPADITVVAVPLHRKKLRERGFNQAELLARELPYPVHTSLVIRIKNMPPQARAASRRERQAAIKGAFALTAGAEHRIIGKNFLIVDDVATTGATLCEVANLLKCAGAEKIYAAVVAHG